MGPTERFGGASQKIYSRVVLVLGRPAHRNSKSCIAEGKVDDVRKADRVLSVSSLEMLSVSRRRAHHRNMPVELEAFVSEPS